MNNDMNNNADNKDNNDIKNRDETERDIEIITLPDSKLQIFGPPCSLGKTNNFTIPRTPNLNMSSTSLFEKGKANFSFSSKVEYLGVGGFSKVYKYRGDLENKAVKKIFADPKYYSKILSAEDSIKREVFGMKKVNCDNSLKVFGVYQNNEKNTYYILMELCDGNMEKYIKDRGYPLNLYEVLALLHQLNKAFYLLDINNIIHRDIKPSNMLYKIDKNINQHNRRVNKKLFGGQKLTFKLGDYGVCIPLYDKTYSKSQFMGTLNFMAPEIYQMKAEKDHPIYTKKIDLFSLGQSILVLMGYIKKAYAITKKTISKLRETCDDLFTGNRREKMLADLLFNYLLVLDPEKRADWNTYFRHQIFEDNSFIQNDNTIHDENIVRIENRLIKRKSMDNYKRDIPKSDKLYNRKKYNSVTNNKKNNNDIDEEKEKVRPFVLGSQKKDENKDNAKTLTNNIAQIKTKSKFNIFNRRNEKNNENKNNDTINNTKDEDKEKDKEKEKDKDKDKEKEKEKEKDKDKGKDKDKDKDKGKQKDKDKDKDKKEDEIFIENKIKSISNITDNFYYNINNNNNNNHNILNHNNHYNSNNLSNLNNNSNHSYHNKKNILNNNYNHNNSKNHNNHSNLNNHSNHNSHNNHNNHNNQNNLNNHSNHSSNINKNDIQINEKERKSYTYINKNKNNNNNRSKKSILDKENEKDKDIDKDKYKEKEKDKNKEKEKDKDKDKDKNLNQYKKIPNNNERNIKKIEYNKNRNETNVTRTLPFDIDKASFEKEKTFTIPNFKGLLTNIDNENNNNNNNDRKNSKKNTINVRNRNIIDKNKDIFKKIINVNNNNKSPTNIKNRNRSNIYGSKTNYKNEKGFETHNHFFSVKDKFKGFVTNKDNIIKNNLINLQDETQNREQNSTRRSKFLNTSQNISPNNYKTIEENRIIFVNDDEEPKYNHNTKNRNHFLSKNTEDDSKPITHKNEREKSRDIRYYKLKINFEPRTRYSKSHMKYNYDRNFNTTVNVTEVNNDKDSIINNYKNHNNNHNNNHNHYITNTEGNIQDNISNDLNENFIYDTYEEPNNIKYNKISYVLNSTNCAKNKSITYFNIRVVDNQVQEDNNNKIKRNNAFYFSKYSRYNKNNKK